MKLLEGTNIIMTRNKGSVSFFIGGYSPLVPYNLGLIISNKNFVRQILSNKRLSVARGRLFPPDDPKGAVVYANDLGFPLVLCQENSQRSEKVIVAFNEKDFIQGYKELANLGENILVEKYFPGEYYRIFFTKNNDFNVIHQLPKPGKERWENVTNQADPSVIKIARKTLSAFPGLPWVGIGLVTKNISQPLSPESYVITEIYHSPGPNKDFIKDFINEVKI